MGSHEDRFTPFAVVVVGGGAGSRFGADLPKQFHPFAPSWAPEKKKPVVAWAIDAFLELPEVSLLVPVMDPDLAREHLADWRAALPETTRGKMAEAIAGGQRRQDSVLGGLRALPADVEIVAVHDAARLFPPMPAVRRAVAAIAGDVDCAGAILALPVVDSIKYADENGDIAHSLDRRRIWRAQTPQVFRRNVLIAALEAVEDVEVTDEAQAVELATEKGRLDTALMGRVCLIEGDPRNLKITTPADLAQAADLPAD